MKKLKFVVIAMLMATIGSIWAEKLPNGVDAEILSSTKNEDGTTRVVLARPLEITTKYGNFTIPQNVPMDFYESGNLKSIIFSDVQEIKTNVGTFKIDSHAKTNQALSKDCMLDFYENGNIKRAYIYGLSSPGSRTTEIQINGITYEVLTRHYISFYDDETVESCYLSSSNNLPQLKAFNEELKHSSKEKVSFYHSGNIKAFVPTVDFDTVYGIQAKRNRDVELSEDGVPISFTPVLGSSYKFNGKYWALAANEPVKFWENGFPKEISVELVNNHFLFYSDPEVGVFFDIPSGEKLSMQGTYNNSPVQSAVTTLRFYEEKTPESVDCYHPFIFKYGDKLTFAVSYLHFDKKVQFDELILDPKISYIVKESQVILPEREDPSKKVRTRTESCHLQKIYFKDSKMYGLGIYTEKIQGAGSFYDKASTCLAEIEGGKVKDVKFLKGLALDSNLIFNEQNEPIGYTRQILNDSRRVIGIETVEIPSKK